MTLRQAQDRPFPQAQDRPLFSHHTSPLEDVWVALDIETTGLSPESDEIIEIGVVKFQGGEVLDTFCTFVNPRRRLNDFIRQFTGITQAEVDAAPSFSQVAGKLAAFVGASPIVGHNLGFDLGFLEKKGLRFSNPRCDTWELAYVLHPGAPEYSLSKLAERMNVSVERPHRAIDDALAAKELFLKLAREAADLDVFILAEMQRLAQRSSWVLSYLLRGIETAKVASRPSSPHPNLPPRGEGIKGTGGEVGVAGLNTQAIAQRLQQGRALRPNLRAREVDVEFVASLLSEGSPLSESLPGFEERAEQVAMARAVAEAINQGKRLIVEAGTGVGKSMAYLLPAILYASMNNKRVVVSTNTINLQEQLLGKDLPVLVDALSRVDDVSIEDLNFTQLKGRANYLCLNRWSHLRSSDGLTDAEARMLAKTLVWLQATESGDRSELNLGHRAAAAPWERISAQSAPGCFGKGGPCFLRAARERAAASHIVVVNHALLLTDVSAGGTLIPEYDILIIDEAHHLEEEATRHFGFDIGQSRVDEHIQSLSGERGLLNAAVTAFRTSSAAATRRAAVEKIANETMALLHRVRDNVASLFAGLADALRNGSEGAEGGGQDFRITTSTRSQPAWSGLETLWENVDLSLSEIGRSLAQLENALEGLENANLVNYDGLTQELGVAQQTNSDLKTRLTEFFPNPKPDGIYWVTKAGQSNDPSAALRTGLILHAAPLHVGEMLNDLLFSQKESVILTSATLSANNSFAHVTERTGFADAEELLLGSPFDYPNAALLCVPTDMPEPNSWAYQEAVERAITDAANAVGGRTMALFTSYASLQATAASIRGDLQARGITVLTQGADGTPQQIVRRFLEDPKSVILGTASFWEGVDLAGDSLMVLLVSRLPFSVPSEPVFAARSELYDNPFMQYAVPQAILRLRQGFGRLIRTRTDRGVAIILDSRIVSKRYGKEFLNSLPPCKLKTTSLHQLPGEIRGWLGRPTLMGGASQTLGTE